MSCCFRHAQYSRCEPANCLIGRCPHLGRCWPTPTVQFVHCYNEKLETMSERKPYRSSLVNRLGYNSVTICMLLCEIKYNQQFNIKGWNLRSLSWIFWHSCIYWKKKKKKHPDLDRHLSLHILILQLILFIKVRSRKQWLVAIAVFKYSDLSSPHTNGPKDPKRAIPQAIKYWLTKDLAPECHVKLLRVTTRFSENSVSQ